MFYSTKIFLGDIQSVLKKLDRLDAFMERLESYEAGRSHLLEGIEAVNRAMAQQNADNRATRELIMNKLFLFWEKAGERDMQTTEAMRGFFQEGVDMARHAGVDAWLEKMHALLKVPPLVAPLDPVPRSSLSNTIPTGPENVAPNKRPAEDDDENRKRRKVGES